MSFQMINSSRCEPRSGISGSYDTSGFSVSRNLRAVFHLGFTIHIPTKTFGGFPFLYILCSIYFWRSFWWWLLWPVEEEMATQSSILAWRIPWTGSLAGYSAWGHKESDTAERTAHTAASVRWYLTVVLLGIDLMTLWGVSFQCFYYFTPKLWVQFASWIWLLETWPCSEFFSDDLR